MKMVVEITKDRIRSDSDTGDMVLIFPLSLLDDFCVSLTTQIKSYVLPPCTCGHSFGQHGVDGSGQCEGGAGHQDFCTCISYTRGKSGN